MPVLFKKRMLWFPTLWGFLLCSSIIVLCLILLFKNIANYLSENQQINAQYLVVEGWLAEPELIKAIDIFKQEDYQLLITTGGPDTSQVKPKYKSYADKAAAFILSTGFDKNRLVVIPTPASAQDRTYLSAVMVRDWFKQNSVTAEFNILSEGVHSRRTHVLYKDAFGQNSKIGIIAAEPRNYDKSHWWRTSTGAKSVLTEAIGLAWVTCCFRPPQQGSHEEKWGGLPQE